MWTVTTVLHSGVIPSAIMNLLMTACADESKMRAHCARQGKTASSKLAVSCRGPSPGAA
jgi:hypothetical protein